MRIVSEARWYGDFAVPEDELVLVEMPTLCPTLSGTRPVRRNCSRATVRRTRPNERQRYASRSLSLRGSREHNVATREGVRSRASDWIVSQPAVPRAWIERTYLLFCQIIVARWLVQAGLTSMLAFMMARVSQEQLLYLAALDVTRILWGSLHEIASSPVRECSCMSMCLLDGQETQSFSVALP